MPKLSDVQVNVIREVMKPLVGRINKSDDSMFGFVKDSNGVGNWRMKLKPTTNILLASGFREEKNHSISGAYFVGRKRDVKVELSVYDPKDYGANGQERLMLYFCGA